MTDRLYALTVVLEADTRDDDAEPIIEAIKQLRGVASVEALVADPQAYMAAERARLALATKLWKVLKDFKDFKDE